MQQEHTGSSSLGREVNDVMESFDFLEAEDTDSSQYESLDSDEPKIVFTPQLDDTLLVHLSYCRHLVDVRPTLLYSAFFCFKLERVFNRDWAATAR